MSTIRRIFEPTPNRVKQGRFFPTLLTVIVTSGLMVSSSIQIAFSQQVGKGYWQADLERSIQITTPHRESPEISIEKGRLDLGTETYVLRLTNTTEAYSTTDQTLVSLDNIKKEHTRMPIHALLWFFNSETLHRNALCHAAESAELSLADMEPCSRFDLESLFGYSHPQAHQIFQGKTVAIEHKQEQNAHVFENDGKIAVRFEPTDISMNKEHTQMFQRFLCHICRMHPEIRRKIVSMGKFPKSIVYRTREGTSERTYEYRFSAPLYSNGHMSFEIPKDYSPHSPNRRLEAIFNKLKTIENPSSQKLFDQASEDIEKFMKKGQIEDAVLAAHRFYILTDNDQGLRDLLNRCGGMADRNIRRIVYGLSNIREIKQMKEELETESSPMAYLLDYYLADVAMAQHRNQEPIDECLLNSLEKDPLIVGAYIDLWRRNLQEWDPYTAWRCLEAARRIAPMHSDLIPVNQLEKMIRADSPDFF